MAGTGKKYEGEQWLNKVVRCYQQMSDTEKNYMLDRLLQESSFAQLYFLQENLRKINHQDFMVLLPKEIVEFIMSFLDFETLCTCCQVSRNWNAFIQSCHGIWRNKCQSLGLRSTELMKHVTENGIETYKQICLRMARQMHLMRTHRGLQNETYHGHTARITAAYYWKNKLATGTEDSELIIWDTEKDHILHKLKLAGDFCVTCISFDDEMLLTGSSTGFLESFSMIQMQHQQLFGHFSAAIFSIDFNSSLNLAVSGSASNVIKLWSLPRGLLLSTLHAHNHWVVKVLLRPWHHPLGRFEKADAVLISMDKKRIIVWSIAKDINVHPPQFVASVLIGNNPLSFFTPGLHFYDHFIYYIQQDLENSPNIYSTKLCKYDLLTDKNMPAVILNLHVKILLAVGTKYLCIITPQCHDPNMFVVDVETLEEVAQWTLPSSCPITPDHPQIVCGCTDWLDGLNGFNNPGVVAAVGLECGNVIVVKWCDALQKHLQN